MNAEDSASALVAALRAAGHQVEDVSPIKPMRGDRIVVFQEPACIPGWKPWSYGGITGMYWRTYTGSETSSPPRPFVVFHSLPLDLFASIYLLEKDHD